MSAAYLRGPSVAPIDEGGFRPCLNKQSFGTEHAARGVARRLGFSLAVYRCRGCGRFHIGSPAAVIEAHERAGLVRRL